MAPRWAANGHETLWLNPRGGQGLPGDLGHLVGPILGPSWAVLGLPWPFLGGPRGHLEANLGLRRAVVGMRCG